RRGTTITPTTPIWSRRPRRARRRREPPCGCVCPEASPGWRPARPGGRPTADGTRRSRKGRSRSSSATRRRGSTGGWGRRGGRRAYLLYARAVADPAAGSAMGEMLLRRTQGGFASPAERVNLERRLVSALTRDCERVPIGYALRREAVNDGYSEGVENVGYDA